MSRILNPRSRVTDLSAVHVGGVEKVEGQGRQQINNEPALEVVECNGPWVRDHFALAVDEGGPEVQYDI
jgi:hypothetical protein